MFKNIGVIVVIVLLLIFIYRKKSDILAGIISGTVVYFAFKYLTDEQDKTKIGGREKRLGNYTEKEIYRILNELNYANFRLNQHPDWCTYNDSLSGKKIQLELDLYSAETAIAIEYNGPQHYSEEYWDSFYKYAKYVQNSIVKTEICRENGVDLIVIPYTVETKDLKKYIKSRLLDIKIIRERIGMTEKEWKKRKDTDKYLPPVREPKIEKIREIKKAVISRELNEIYE